MIKRPIAVALATLLLAAGVSPAAAQSRIDTLADDMHLVTPETQRAIKVGLAYLARECHKEGHIGGKDFRVATTALGGLAFLAGGNVPGRGLYAEQVEGALDFILRVAKSNRGTGYISLESLEDKSKMHGHGYATLFLAEIYGMTRDENTREKIADAIRRAIGCIERAQERNEAGWGGWGYTPGDNTHEGSITVCCLQALRAARNVGFEVNRETLIRAIKYLIQSANPDGSFKYRIGGGRSHSTFPLTAAAMSTMNAFGVYDDQQTRVLGHDFPELPRVMRRGLLFIDRYLGNKDESDRYYLNFYYYAEFYAAQAYYNSRFPGNRGRQWLRYYEHTRDVLLDPRHRFGIKGDHWLQARYGDAYATAIATMILQIPYKYLPIFQR